MTRGDDLGRIVIPKEIRRTLKIREGDPLEIYTEKDGGVIFRKYSPMSDLQDFATQYAEALAKGSSLTAAICDEDNIIAAAGSFKKELVGKDISSGLHSLIKERVRYAGGQAVAAVDGSGLLCAAAYPIIANGDVGGAVLLVSDTVDRAGESDINLVLAAAEFLGRQMED